MRLLAGLTALAALLIVCPCAAQQPSKEACLDAYRVNQPLRRDGKLKEAREALLVCARDPCPAVLQKDCVEWLRDVEDKLPSLVFGATDASGDLQDVTVTMDGSPIATRLDGRAVDIDPGPHRFELEHAGARPVERDVVVREGEKGRRLDVRFEPLAAAAPPITVAVMPVTHERRPVRWPTILLGVAGIGGVGVAASVGIWSIVMRSNLDDCKPNCSDARLAPVRTGLLVADVTGAVSLAALAAATVLFLTRPTVRDHGVQAWIAPGSAGLTASF